MAGQVLLKAAGQDNWFPASWNQLPLPFFDYLAQMMTVAYGCLQGTPLPNQWKQVRVTLIPKPDQSQRPLSIAMCQQY
jgi:hypothetical protein